jgi:hypothetical protein
MIGAADPCCPECDGPVGERALYCMHCGADFGDEGSDAAGGDGVAPAVDASAASEATSGGDRRGGTDSAAADDGPGEHGDLLDRLFHPEGFLDDSLTVVLGVVVGLVCGVVALIVVGASAGGGPGLLAALVAWIGVTGWLVRQYSLFGAVRSGCYAVAVALLALPVVGLTDAAQGGTFGGRVLLFLAGEVVFGLLALPLVGIGYTAGRRRPDPDASGADG